MRAPDRFPHSLRNLLLCLVTLGTCWSHAEARPPTCEPDFLNNGLPGPTLGSNGLAMAAYKDALYLGQVSPSGQDGFGLMRRAGNEWKPVGGGLHSSVGESLVYSLAVHDPDGEGNNPPMLIAGGLFDVNGVRSNIVAWDGQVFIDIDQTDVEPNGPNSGVVRSVASIDLDGPGPRPPSLIVAGDFTTFAGSELFGGMIMLENGAWTSFVSGLPPMSYPGFFVHRLVVLDPDGAGPEPRSLYALMSSDSLLPINHIWRFSAQADAWVPVGPTAGNNETNEIVFDMTVFDPDNGFGIGDRLVAAGTIFGSSRVASYNPMTNAWSPLPGAPGGIFANANTYWVTLDVHDPDGDGPQPRTLFMGRGFEFNGVPISAPVYAFNGSSYSAIHPQGLTAARLLRVFDDIRGDYDQPTLYLAGQSVGFDSSMALRHDGLEFRPAADTAGNAFRSPDAEGISAITMIDSPVLGVFAPTLVVATRGAGGDLRGVSHHEPLYSWDGSSFSPYPPAGFEASPCCVGLEITAMATVDPDGAGPLGAIDGLAVAGNFASIDPLDGSGPQPASGIAVWTGSAWLRPNIVAPVPVIRCIVDLPPSLAGGLNAVFVGGDFSGISNVSCSNVALWFTGGTVWDGMLGGVNGTVYDAVVFDPDGPSGTDHVPTLFVAGSFNMAGGQFANGIVRWGNFAWQPLVTHPDGAVFDLHLWDRDGPGGLPPALAVGGNFSMIGEGTAAQGAARLDASGWTGLGNSPAFEFTTRFTTLDPDGHGAQGEQLYAVHSNLAANRRFSRLRQVGGNSFVWDTIAQIGPPMIDGGVVALTIDDDASGRNQESIVLAGDLPLEFGTIRTDGLIRYAAPNRFLVDDIYATLNGAGAYLCGVLAGADDTVTFDYDLLTGNPDQEGYADLISDAAFGAMEVLNGDVALDLFFGNLVLTQPGSNPSLVVGDGPISHAELFMYTSNEGPRTASVESVVVAASATPTFIPQNFFVYGIHLNIAQELRVSPGGIGGYMLLHSSSLQSGGDVSLATDPGTNGELFFILNSGWTHLAGGTLEVGGAGFANLDIDSGSVAQTNFDLINVAAQFGGASIIDIGENGSALWIQTGGSLFVGHAGDGLMKVRNQSTFQGNDFHLIVGHLYGSTGRVEVSDTPGEYGGSVLAANEISIGRFSGEGRLVLEGSNPATRVSAFNITVGPLGMIEGFGTIEAAGTLENGGVIAPESDPTGLARGAADPAVLTVLGDYHQRSAPENEGIPGRLQADIGGVIRGFDQLVVDGVATLGGQLDVRLLHGTDPSPGFLADGIPIVVANSINGAFDVANFPGLPGSLTGAPRFLRFESRAVPRGISMVVVVEDSLATPPPDAAAPQNYDVGGVGTDGALGDLNLDGRPDIAITIPDASDPANNPGSIVILFNGGSIGGFWQGFTSTSQITVEANPASIVIADFDGLNGNDIAYVSASGNSLHVLLNDGAGVFSGRGGVAPIILDGRPLRLIQSDFNLGGAPDVVVVTEEVSTVTALFNTADFGGVFTGFQDRETIPIAAGATAGTGTDVDNDKWDDIVVPNPENNTTIVVSNNGNLFVRGGPVFNPVPVVVPVPGGPVDVDARDLNLDGFVDVAFATRQGGTVTILLGNGTPNFLPPLTVPAGSEPSRLVLVDLDGDDDHDIAVITTNESEERIVRVIRNDLFGGNLSFVAQSDLLPGSVPQLVLADDLTGDGTFDLVTVNDSGGVRMSGQEPRGSSDRQDVTVFTFAACRGDANNDRTVDMQDIAATLTNFGMNYLPGTGPGDADGNGVVNFADITASLTSWGRVCP